MTDPEASPSPEPKTKKARARTVPEPWGSPPPAKGGRVEGPAAAIVGESPEPDSAIPLEAEPEIERAKPRATINRRHVVNAIPDGDDVPVTILATHGDDVVLAFVFRVPKARVKVS